MLPICSAESAVALITREGFHFREGGGRNSCKSEAVEDKLTLSEVYFVWSTISARFGILRSFQVAPRPPEAFLPQVFCVDIIFKIFSKKK